MGTVPTRWKRDKSVVRFSDYCLIWIETESCGFFYICFFSADSTHYQSRLWGEITFGNFFWGWWKKSLYMMNLQQYCPGFYCCLMNVLCCTVPAPPMLSDRLSFYISLFYFLILLILITILPYYRCTILISTDEISFEKPLVFKLRNTSSSGLLHVNRY